MEQPDYRIKKIFLEKAAAFLIYRPGIAILVDCGISGSESVILEIMSGLDLDPPMLKLLILTHAHFDHAGSAGKLKEVTGCQILVHRSEAEGLRKGFISIPAGTRWKAKVLSVMGRLIARRIAAYPGAEPDILSEDSCHLSQFGFPGKVIYTPGHTQGSQVILMEGGELFAGDTLSGVPGKEHFPPFAEDLPALLRSWEEISTLPVTTIYPAHGRIFPFESFLAELVHARNRYR